MAEQIRRNQRIVRDRARGYTWATVAEQNDVTARRARQVVREYHDDLKLHPVAEDERIDEAIEFTVQAMEDLPTLAETPRNDAFKLGAINSRLKPLERLVALLQATEVLPTRLHLIELGWRWRESRVSKWRKMPEPTPLSAKLKFAPVCTLGS